jgi:uncharacterized membrane protein
LLRWQHLPLLNNEVMKIFGHPVHMMLIHFPSALLPMDFICSAIYFYTGNTSFASAAFFALAGGTALGWLAVMTGMLDLVFVIKDNANVLKKTLIHGGINTTVLLGYSLVAYKAYIHYPHMDSGTVSSLVVKGVLLTALVVGNFMGGSLILKEKIAVAK